MTLTLRPALPADLDALVALEARAFAPADRFARRNLRRMLTSPSAWLCVCERADSVVGSVILLFRQNAQIARLYSLAVDPAAVGQGVGRALIIAAGDESRERGCHTLRLEVRASNARANSLYVRSGFRLRETRKDYYADGEAAHVYECPLDGDTDLT